MTSEARPFYVTTPIYYINDAPHLGHAYTTVACDALARWQRLRGRNVKFLTGTDEHGQKVEAAARARSLQPQEHADKMVVRFQDAWRALGVQPDDFIRTTEPRHVAGVEELWRRLVAAGAIEKGSYRGPYCVGCESFFPESQLVDGKCPAEGHPIEILEEESYFFRLSAWQEKLLAFYSEHPDFITPRTRFNEVVSFVEGGLADLSVSRTKLTWGIPVPGDPKHVMYVWIDALANYVTALGYGPGRSEAGFSPFWPADVQVLGKDILRFHAVYWPAFLLAAGLPPPQRLLVHGWWLRDGAKMSKTRGNVADAMRLVEWFGPDAVRYFLLREIPLGSDGSYSEEALVDRINADLANDLGNTLSRVTKVLATSRAGLVPRPAQGTGLREVTAAAWTKCAAAWDAHDPTEALKATWELLAETSRRLVAAEPWKRVKNESPEAQASVDAILHDAAEVLRHVAVMAAPVMPLAAKRLHEALGLTSDPATASLPLTSDGGIDWGFPVGGAAIPSATPLFPRIDKAAFFEDAVAPMADAKVEKQVEKQVALPTTKEIPGVIQYDDFAKIKLRTARVLACAKHPDADKLLVLDLDDGSGTPRRICAGVARWYAPEDLVGKTLVVVSNLAPRKLRGIESQGMLLASNVGEGEAERVVVVTLPDGVPPGAEVR